MKDLVHLLLPRVRFTSTTWSWSELLGMWSTWSWSELLGEAARDVVDVVGVVSGASAGGEVTVEPYSWRWCAIKVGKSVAKPQRVQW